MHSMRSLYPLLRATLVIGVMVGLVTNITFAALRGTAVLANGTVSSGTALLLVDGNEDAVFGSSEAGFTITDVSPGGPPVPEPAETFDLKNDGDVTFQMFVSIPSAPTTSGSGTVDLDRVHLAISCSGSDGLFDITASLQELIDANAGGGILMDSALLVAGDTADCQLQASIDVDGVNGNDATIDAFDLEFNGTNVEEIP